MLPLKFPHRSGNREKKERGAEKRGRGREGMRERERDRSKQGWQVPKVYKMTNLAISSFKNGRILKWE
jgi:hypothetical protein